MKRLLTVFVCMLMVLTLSACSSSELFASHGNNMKSYSIVVVE